jgi:hypothetical protein
MKRNTTGRLKVLAILVALSFLMAGSGAVLAESVVSSHKPVIVSDDITNKITGVKSASDANENNGHGNNDDGVDISNPGDGDGGPTGATDPSGETDDEGKGGGSMMAQGKK